MEKLNDNLEIGRIFRITYVEYVAVCIYSSILEWFGTKLLAIIGNTSPYCSGDKTTSLIWCRPVHVTNLWYYFIQHFLQLRSILGKFSISVIYVKGKQSCLIISIMILALIIVIIYWNIKFVLCVITDLLHYANTLTLTMFK